MRKAKMSPSRKMCSTNSILVYFGYVIEEFMSFHLVYDLLLLQFVLGYPPFEHRSPGLCGRGYLFSVSESFFRHLSGKVGV